MGKEQDMKLIANANKIASDALSILLSKHSGNKGSDPMLLNIGLLTAYESVTLLAEAISNSIDNITKDNEKGDIQHD